MLQRTRLLLAIAALLCTASAWADDPAAVRIGFLLNFARYVEWPELTLKPGASLRLCLAPGDAEMAAQFGEIARQVIQGRPTEVKLLPRPAEANGCHLIYLPAEVPGTLSAWRSAAEHAGAVTVSDMPDFIDAGGMIGLVPVAGRYRFDINLAVARQANLRLSSQLLKLARTVK